MEAEALHRLAGVQLGPCAIPKTNTKQFSPATKSKSCPSTLHTSWSTWVPLLLTRFFVSSKKIIITIVATPSRVSWASAECNRWYDLKDFVKYPCDSKWCPSCHRKDCRAAFTHGVWTSSLYQHPIVVCVTENSLATNATPTIYIVAAKT